MTSSQGWFGKRVVTRMLSRSDVYAEELTASGRLRRRWIPGASGAVKTSAFVGTPFGTGIVALIDSLWPGVLTDSWRVAIGCLVTALIGMLAPSGRVVRYYVVTDSEVQPWRDEVEPTVERPVVGSARDTGSRKADG